MFKLLFKFKSIRAYTLLRQRKLSLVTKTYLETDWAD